MRHFHYDLWSSCGLIILIGAHLGNKYRATHRQKKRVSIRVWLIVVPQVENPSGGRARTHLLHYISILGIVGMIALQVWSLYFEIVRLWLVYLAKGRRVISF
jgi:hypothetical protein